MKKIPKIIVSVAVLALILLPVLHFVSAQGLVPCDESSTPCDFGKFLDLVNNVLHFIIFDLSLPICAIMFAYAGFMLVTAGGSTEKMSKAKRMFWNVALGFAIAVAAWLIVELILSLLGYNGSWIGFK
ncbi:MAG TPA: hypothetical protein VG694_01225 [Candidatus Paceibacterota bacterium]|jgi:hypothetical protein|nr:hypothetical protein [Candidatus Paceibacterota bacterium]